MLEHGEIIGRWLGQKMFHIKTSHVWRKSYEDNDWDLEHYQ